MTLTGLSDGDPADYLDLAAAVADHSTRSDTDPSLSLDLDALATEMTRALRER